MSYCCTTNEQVPENSGSELCPSCHVKGKRVKIITLKSMLKPTVLDSLKAGLIHYFCSSEACNTVYFDTDKKSYSIMEIKVPVFQKDITLTVPVCYCFDWTREKIKQFIEKGPSPNPVEHIRENIKENRCGCEVNNPQGSCCLGNVTTFINQLP